jgi:6-phosphogluconolactonase (cycloisomerase 2 family)
MPALIGCGNFFVYPGSSTTTSTGDYVFVSNSTTGTTYINGYSISNGTLAATSGSPVNVSVVPSAMAIMPNNNLLYIASSGGTSGTGNGLYAFVIGSSGALTAENSGGALAGGYPVSIDISPDGQWLFALDGLTNTISEYAINSSTAALTLKNQLTFAATGGASITPYQIRVAPTGSYVVAALGDAGEIVIPLTTSSGALGSTYGINTINVGTGADYSVAMDGSNNLYVGRTGGTTATTGVYVYALGASSASLVSTSVGLTGAGPKSIVLSSGYSYLYTGNETDTTVQTAGGSISEFSQSSANLTSLGINISSPVEVFSMGRDNSTKYILAAGYNSTSNGLILYSIGSNGALTQASAVATAAPVPNGAGLPSYPAVMALTH